MVQIVCTVFEYFRDTQLQVGKKSILNLDFINYVALLMVKAGDHPSQ